jgi:hypothetical protein
MKYVISVSSNLAPSTRKSETGGKGTHASGVPPQHAGSVRTE